MKTINNCHSTTIINKSKFICELIYINEESEVKQHLESLKDKYKSATHYCYAYIYENVKHFHDDGEPSGTAGLPILNVLESNNLNHVLCVVIRYFGGIKLGAGGLVRAYTKSVTNCLEKTKHLELKKGKLIEIEFRYEKIKTIDSLVSNDILSKQFNNNIKYKLAICEDKLEDILELLKNNVINLTLKNDLYIKK